MSTSILGLGADLSSAANTVAQSLSVSGVRTASGAAATSSASTSGSSASSGDISSNDFLTLLVTEMKNQDPTQPTDPNAYIQQLTEVNSLQQLIAINQDLTSTVGASGGGSGSSAPVAATGGV